MGKAWKEISDDSDLHETALKAKERAVKEARRQMRLRERQVLISE